jgi:molybdate transport system substrate-binding protein
MTLSDPPSHLKDKTMTIFFSRAALVFALLFAHISLVKAAEIKVFSTIGVQAALEELTPQFEKLSGHRLSITWATAAVLVKRIQAGETADLLVLTQQSLDAMIKEGKALAGSNSNFSSSGMAVVVKQGSPKVDISTPEAYKQTLLNAKTIAYSNPAFGGASGVFFAKSLEQMGIAESIKAKAKYPPASGNAAQLVVDGEADLAVQQEPEVMAVQGVALIGAPPGVFNNITTYTAGIGATSSVAGAAKSLIDFLQSPQAGAVYLKRGLKPEKK